MIQWTYMGNVYMKVLIDNDLCKGCGICAAFCPKEILVLDEHDRIKVTDRDECIGCRQCEYHCPDFALRMGE